MKWIESIKNDNIIVFCVCIIYLVIMWDFSVLNVLIKFGVKLL